MRNKHDKTNIMNEITNVQTKKNFNKGTALERSVEKILAGGDKGSGRRLKPVESNTVIFGLLHIIFR